MSAVAGTPPPRRRPNGLTRRVRRWLSSPPGADATTAWLLVAGLFAIPAFLATWATLSGLQPGDASRDWPTTYGTVLPMESDDGEESFRVAYTVDGVLHETDRARFGPISDREERSLPRKYPPGSRVLVYYDLESGRAVLEPGRPSFLSLTTRWLLVAVPAAFGTIQVVRRVRAGAFSPED